MMKYEPIRVISQMTSSSARPMGREPPPVLSLGFPRSAPKFLPLARAESPKRGEYITVFRVSFLHSTQKCFAVPARAPLAGLGVRRAPLVLRGNPGRRFQSCQVMKDVTGSNHEGAKTTGLAGKRNSGGRLGCRARIQSSA